MWPGKSNTVDSVGYSMCAKTPTDNSELEMQLERSLNAARCPHCGQIDPVIRVRKAFSDPAGGDVYIFSCQACKRILNCALVGGK